MAGSQDLGLVKEKIKSVTLTSGNHAPGTIDTYTAELLSGGTFTFDVYNGTNGASGVETVTATFADLTALQTWLSNGLPNMSGVFPNILQCSYVTSGVNSQTFVAQLSYETIGSGTTNAYHIYYCNDGTWRDLEDFFVAGTLKILYTSDSLVSYVPTTREIAGLGLGTNISKESLLDALDVNVPLIYRYFGGKNLIGNKANVLYAIPPLHAGDILTMSTSDGSQITGGGIKFTFFDKNKHELEYWTFAATLRERTITLTENVTEALYVSINALHSVPLQLEIGASKTAYNAHVENIFEFNNVLRQELYEITTQGDDDRQVLFIPQSNYSLDVKIPFRILVKPYDGTYTTADIANSGYVTINLPHSSILYYDIDENEFSVTSYTNLQNLTPNQVVVAYNNYMKVRGMWAYYQQNQIVRDNFDNLSSALYEITTQGDDDRQVTFESDGTAYGLNVSIPFRLLLDPYKGSYVTQDIASSGKVIVNLPHANVLYYDIDENEFFATPVANKPSLTNRQIVVAYNNGGIIRGMWAYYQQNQWISGLEEKNAGFETIEFSCRQGEVGGCPENSLIGFKTAKSYGYNKVRASVQFTSDGIPVCFHDARLNTTGIVYKNGSPTTDNYKISELTYLQLQDYDFGAYKGTAYVGTKICSVEDFVKQSRKLGQNIVLEIKDATDPTTQNLTDLYNLVAQNGMLNHCVFSGYATTGLSTLTTINERCNIGYIASLTSTEISNAASFLTGKNTVYFDMYANDISLLTNAIRIQIASAGLLLKIGSAYSNANVLSYIKCDVIECANIVNPSNYLIKGN